MAAAPGNRTGSAAGLHATLRVVGGSAAVAAIAGILASHQQPDHVPAESGYRLAFLIFAALDLLAAAAAAALVTQPPRPV